MPKPTPRQTPPVRGFFTGLANLAEFLRECAIAGIEVVIGRPAKPSGKTRR
jgi:hypothetical protein